MKQLLWTMYSPHIYNSRIYSCRLTFMKPNNIFDRKWHIQVSQNSVRIIDGLPDRETITDIWTSMISSNINITLVNFVWHYFHYVKIIQTLFCIHFLDSNNGYLWKLICSAIKLQNLHLEGLELTISNMILVNNERNLRVVPKVDDSQYLRKAWASKQVHTSRKRCSKLYILPVFIKIHTHES